MTAYTLHVGDCRAVLPTLAAESADAVVCDPPYALTSGNGTKGFMGKSWDTAGVAFDPATWAAVLRVARPGGYLLAFGGTRTWHRLVCAIEDGGWQVVDSIQWLYGSGFPKGKSQLKPSHEPICLARKSAARVLPLQIDAARIAASDGYGPVETLGATKMMEARPWNSRERQPFISGSTAGRWPPNICLVHAPECVETGTRRVKATRSSNERQRAQSTVYGGGIGAAPTYPTITGMADPDGYETVPDHSGCVEGCPVAELDRQSGTSVSSGGITPRRMNFLQGVKAHGDDMRITGNRGGCGDTGGASRFFPTFRYEAKAPTRERTLPDGTRVSHPTQKPLALMRWLVRLVAEPGATVLDPFTGSGSTGAAALAMGCRFVGIEQDPQYANEARQRLDAVRPTLDTAQEEAV